MTCADSPRVEWNIMATLKELQEALVKLWGDPDELERCKLGDHGSDLQRELIYVINPSRMRLYQDDVAARRMSLMDESYGLTMRILGKDAKRLVTKFWVKNPSSFHNPVHEMKAFPEFLRSENVAADTVPYLVDLAAYEWLWRSVLMNSTDLEEGKSVDINDPVIRRSYRPVVNSTLEIRHFDYPVHTIANRVAGHRWKKSSYEIEDAFMVGFQNPDNREEFRPLELGEWTFNIIELAMQKKCSYDELIQESIKLLNDDTDDSEGEITAEIIDLFIQLEELGIFMGSRKLAREDSDNE